MNRKLMLSVALGLLCKAGYQPDKVAPVCVEVAASVSPSSDTAPRGGMPAWQDPRIHNVEIESWATANGHHPASCAASCIWTGANCLCNQDKDAGKKL